MALVSIAPAAWARPGGSYQQTCDGIRQRGPYLTAECETRYGDTRLTSLDVRGCRGDIANSNGQLTCKRGWGGYDGDGGFSTGRYGDDDRSYGGYRSPRFDAYRYGFSDD